MGTQVKKKKVREYVVDLQFYGSNIPVKASTKSEAIRKAIEKMAKPSMLRKHLNKHVTFAEINS